MSFLFTNKEVDLLIELSEDYPELSAKIHSIHPHVYYQSHIESVKQDVISVIEGDDYGKIDEETLMSIVLRVMNYNSGDYNIYIDSTIRSIVGDKHE